MNIYLILNHVTHDISTRRFSWLNENQIVPMNGFADHGLDEAAFGEKKGFTEGLRTFDAFRKLHTNLLHGVFPMINSLSMSITCNVSFHAHPQDSSFGIALELTNASKNQTHLHPSQLRRWLRDAAPALLLFPPFAHRVPSLVSRA